LIAYCNSERKRIKKLLYPVSYLYNPNERLVFPDEERRLIALGGEYVKTFCALGDEHQRRLYVLQHIDSLQPNVGDCRIAVAAGLCRIVGSSHFSVPRFPENSVVSMSG
jgi:hypothetical protein